TEKRYYISLKPNIRIKFFRISGSITMTCMFYGFVAGKQFFPGLEICIYFYVFITPEVLSLHRLNLEVEIQKVTFIQGPGPMPGSGGGRDIFGSRSSLSSG
ncbi:MAG: hypothetical protein KDC94_09565, partial [Aequorivita sp.]|nr:hypothetical protein [Aequorivita sp.]